MDTSHNCNTMQVFLIFYVFVGVGKQLCFMYIMIRDNKICNLYNMISFVIVKS